VTCAKVMLVSLSVGRFWSYCQGPQCSGARGKGKQREEGRGQGSGAFC